MRINRRFAFVLLIVSLSYILPSRAAEPLINRKDVKVRSLSFVTFDALKTAQRYAYVLGATSWTVTKAQVELPAPDGRRQKASNVKIMASQLGQLEIVLLQPTENSGVLWDYLSKNGVFLHHIGLGVLENPDELVRRLAKGGFPLKATMRQESGATQYILDTQGTIGAALAFEGPPARRSGGQKVQTITLQGSQELAASALKINHVGVVVRDAVKAAQTIEALFELDTPTNRVPRYSRDLHPLKNIIDNDRRLNAEMEMTILQTYFAGFYLEIIEPRMGITRYTKFLTAHGNGVQHMRPEFPDKDKDYEQYLRNEGYIIAMAGEIDNGQPIDGEFTTPAYRYMSSEVDLGVDIELGAGPRRRMPQ